MPSFSNKVHIVGVGDDGVASLSDSARARLAEAEVVYGPDRLLKLIGPSSSELVAVGTDLDAMLRRIEKEGGRRKTVVLASGDPLFYGVARLLIDRLGKENFEVVPHVSIMQLAFARVMETWDEAYLTNAANHPAEEIVERIRTSEKVGLFTSEAYPPAAIARDLLREGIDYFRVYVCENLGGRNEVITQGSLSEIAGMDFSPLNVMILVRLPDVPDQARRTVERRIFGNPDEAFKHSRPKRGLVTPMEVRTLALAQLAIRLDSVVWDVGAGSGSVAIEAAHLAKRGRVFAIEPDVEDCQRIADNAALFEASNVEIVCGRAPEALAGLPAPDGVFLGGIGREIAGILETAYDRLRPNGRLVANVASLESTSAITRFLRMRATHVGLLMVNISRGAYQLESIRFEAANPSFLIFATKSNGAPPEA